MRGFLLGAISHTWEFLLEEDGPYILFHDVEKDFGENGPRSNR